MHGAAACKIAADAHLGVVGKYRENKKRKCYMERALDFCYFVEQRENKEKGM